MIKYGPENRNGGFGTKYLPSKYLTHGPSEKNTNSLVNELATLLTSGMIN